MRTITVKASTTYDIIIGNNLFSKIGKLTADLFAPGKIAIISDSNVFPLFG